MTISYKGVPIKRGWLGLSYQIGWMKRGPFADFDEVREDIDAHIVEVDEENIYDLPSVRQSIEEDRR